MSSGTDWVRVYFTASDYSTVHCHQDLTCRELVEKILSKRFPETPDIVRHYWISTERRNGAIVCPNLTYSEACVVYGGRIAAFYLKLRWLPACNQRDLAALELKLLEFIYKQAKEEHLLSVSTTHGGLRLGVINIALNQERPPGASESAIKRAATAESKAIYKGATHGHHMFPQVVLTDVKPKILRRYTADSLCDLWRRSRSTLLAEWFCLMLSELPAAFLPSVPCRVLLGARADARLAVTRDGDIRLELRDSAPISVGRVQSLQGLELCKSPEDSGVSLTIAFQPPLASLTVELDNARRADALLHLLLDAAHLTGCPEAAVTALHPAHRCQRLLECAPDSDYSDLQPPPESGAAAATGADYYSSATASPANAAATVSRPDSAGSLDDVFDRHSASPSPAAALAKAASATASVAPSAAPPKPPMPPSAAADSPAVSPVPKGVAAAAATAAALPAHEEAVVAAAVSLVRSLNSLVQA
uniref:FERM domain-containing protein n=1 Tax=Macrostomum lignano TaxID=282301 RepID=A0A1I8GKZ7_9PLAT